MLDVLHFHSISTLVDIRAFPRSRRLPHFNRETLEKALPTAGMRYVWLKELGGYRKKQRDDSPNLALRNASFRNYADYMLSPEFGGAVAQLVQIAEESRTAYMCAERVWFHCHCMLVSDWLTAHGHAVLHIDHEGTPIPHRLTAAARLVEGQLLYRDHSLLS